MGEEKKERVTLWDGLPGYDLIEEIESYDYDDVEIFTDVDFSTPNSEAISYLKNNNVVSGYPDGSFKPENPLNRAELIKILVEGTGYDPDASEYKNCFLEVSAALGIF